MKKSSRRVPYHYQKVNDAHEGEFIWLISLSDLMMLLFVFFVVLFSFTFRKLSASDFQRIKVAFNADEAKAAHPIDEIQAQLLKWVVDRKLIDGLEVVRKEDALILEIKEKLLFPQGESTLNEGALEIIPILREALSKIPSPYRLGIEGHTDDVPVAGESDNWQLSTRRALTVFKELHLPPELENRAVVMGFGPTRPLAPNRDEQGRQVAGNQAKNRRVTIRIF
jgi:chemotaxis protein MotB